ncbi:uncharacterized protein LOC131804472 [Musca domestica]|uniref:Uncharacterized protein LOC131804472 n=1 Tax=Musca domestica TaxID=7370 RepID=A0A1I8NKS8_MUSDO|nr:uncharacterized protein LOC131804472 [Musca domestica]
MVCFRKLFIVFALVAAAAATHLSNEYLPPKVGGAVESYAVETASAPVSYAAPAAVESYQVEEAAPAHTFSDADGYRYKTLRRRVIRRQRRDVSNEYLPPVAVSESVPEYVNTAPTQSFETVEAAPAHTFSDAEGYRYKTHRRRVIRRQRRDVSNEYLPPVATNNAAQVATSYSGPAVATSYSAPAVATSYSAPAPAVQTYEVESAAPAHTFSQADGYRYKTQRRRVIRRN